MLTTGSSIVLPFQPKPQNGFVRLTYSLLDSSTWQSLSPVERSIYVDMARRFNGHNNGQISYSLRDAQRALRISRSTALRAFQTLQNKNLAICCQRGSFDLKTKKAKLSEWRLPAMVSPGHPPKVSLENPAADLTKVSPGNPVGFTREPNEGVTREPKNIDKKEVDIDKKEGLPSEAREDSVWIRYDSPQWDMIERFGHRAVGKVFMRYGRCEGHWIPKMDLKAIEALAAANGGGQ
jgi:hypothetical protein